LRVGVMAGLVSLWSRRLGREVMPRLSSAYNYLGDWNLPVVRFLMLLQSQGKVWAYPESVDR
jgi:hypothetical protein